MDSKGLLRRQDTSREGNEVKEEPKTQVKRLLDLPSEVLELIVDYLLPTERFELALVSKAANGLIFPSDHHRPSIRAWRNVTLLPITQSSWYSKRDRLILDSTSTFGSFVLPNIRTLVLDGCSDISGHWLISELLNTESDLGKAHRIQILSLRGFIYRNRGFNWGSRLCGPRGTFPPTLQGLYVFSDEQEEEPLDPGAHCFVSKRCERRLQFDRKSSSRPGTQKWENILDTLKGRLAFDSENCRGQAHYRSDSILNPKRDPEIAVVRITTTCAGCGICPSMEDGEAPNTPILFAPIPIHSSNLATATSSKHIHRAPGVSRPTLRCMSCVDDCYCRGCKKWWCQSCSIVAALPTETPTTATAVDSVQSTELLTLSVVTLDCYECGKLCRTCHVIASRKCELCSGLYCLEHNEGSTEIHCEWCIAASKHKRPRSNTIPSPVNVVNPSARATEIDVTLHNIAVLSDPGRATSSSHRSPQMHAAPHPMVFLSTRNSPVVPGRGGQKAKTAYGPEMKSTAPGVPPAAGMRFRTMMAGGNGASSGSSAGSSVGGTGAGKVLAGRAGGLVR